MGREKCAEAELEGVRISLSVSDKNGIRCLSRNELGSSFGL